MTYFIKCAECTKETDANEYSTSFCGTCKNDYCSSLSTDCFYIHHNKTGCKGLCRTITNPKWIVNLVKTLDK
jgi:hypothetical protein